MKYRFIAKLACQIMAIYYFIISMSMIPNFIVAFVSYHDRWNDMGTQIASWAAMALPTLIASILLWVFADKISKLMAGDALESTEAISLGSKNVAVLAFVIIGMFILTRSIPDLIRLIVFINMISPQFMNSETKVYVEYLTRIIMDILQILMGLWLLLGARGIVKFIRGLRDFGADAVQESKQ